MAEALEEGRAIAEARRALEHDHDIHEPPIAACVPTRPGRVDQHRREALRPSEDRDEVDGDAAFGQ
jgi:hypothetical protein